MGNRGHGRHSKAPEDWRTPKASSLPRPAGPPPAFLLTTAKEKRRRAGAVQSVAPLSLPTAAPTPTPPVSPRRGPSRVAADAKPPVFRTNDPVGLRCRAAEIWAAQQRTPHPMFQSASSPRRLRLPVEAGLPPRPRIPMRRPPLSAETTMVGYWFRTVPPAAFRVRSAAPGARFNLVPRAPRRDVRDCRDPVHHLFLPSACPPPENSSFLAGIPPTGSS